MKIMKIIQILRPALAALLLLAAGAEAAVPRLINFQGKLSDSGGEPVASAVTMVFKIYTAASGGAPVWTETQTVTPDASGVYSVMLGAATPLDISFSLPYWLGVTVGADSEMLPRYRMASSPYALNSSTAAWAEGADWPTITNKPDLTVQGNVFNGASQLVQLLGDGKLPILDGSNLTGLPTAFLADGAVTTAKLADGAVTDVKVSLSTAAISSGQFGDSRVAISTQALSGGTYNLAGRLVQLGADGSLPGLSGVNLTGLTKAQVGLGSVDNTSDADKPVSTAQLAALNLKASLAGAVFTGAISASNLSGVNTGDQTDITGNAATVTNGVYTTGSYANPSWLTSLATSKVDLSTVTAALASINLALSTAVYTTGDQTIGGVKTFTNPIIGSITGNAATVTTNANLTGVVTSVGNATSIGAGAITNLMLANTAVANLSGTNTGDQTNITGNAATVTNGVYTTGLYANPSWLTSLATSKIDLSTVTAALTSINLALSTAVYTTGDQTIGGVKTFTSAIAGDITGNAATATTAVKATNIAGGSLGQLLYQTAADSTGMLAAGLAGQVLQMGGAGAPAWVTAAASGDVFKAATQTFTGENTFRALTYFSSSVYVTGGGIYSTGTAGGAALSGAGTRFMWIPNKYALRAGGVDGTQWNAASIGDYSAAFGFNNTASGLKSVVAGGEYNTASGEKAAIGGGLFNTAAAIYGTVAGGAQNTAGNTASVGGGQNNAAGGQYAAIAGGLNNVASGRAAVASGEDNTAGDTYAAVGGGKLNRAGAYAATVSGGQGNTAGAQYSSVAGGDNNKATGVYSAVAGGRDNTALGNNSFAAGTASSSTANGAFTWSDSDGTVITENNVADRTWFKNKGGFLVTATTNSADGGLFLNADNFVGIGTTVPTSTLSVTGKLTLKDGTEGLDKVLTSDANGLASWQPPAGGDVYKASTQTFTGLNTFTSTITAKGFANLSQSIVLGSVTTFAADGSGVVLMTFNGTGNIATITGCSSGAVGQGQRVTFVVSAWMVGGISFADTIPAAAAADTMLLNGAAGTWTPPASAAALGAAITLLCTTVNTATPPAETFVKLWVEVGRSLSGV